MGALGGCGNGGIWGLPPFHSQQGSSGKSKRRRPSSRDSSSSDSVEATEGTGYRFPIKQAATASCLALTGDTIAQLRDRWVKHEAAVKQQAPDFPDSFTDVMPTLVADHNWLRALRMASYGFLLYGPGSYAWYQYLDHCMPKQTVGNILMKVILNQIVLGPSVIAVVFAWNNLWQGKLSELPSKYQNDALPTLLLGFRFWIPVSVLNFCCESYVATLVLLILLKDCDCCQGIQGGSSSSSCCFHVDGLYILELLLVFNHEQVTFSAAKVLCKEQCSFSSEVGMPAYLREMAMKWLELCFAGDLPTSRSTFTIQHAQTYTMSGTNNFTPPPGYWRSQQVYGDYSPGDDDWNHMQPMNPSPQPLLAPPNLRHAQDQWWSFQDRLVRGPPGITRFPAPPRPLQLLILNNTMTRDVNPRPTTHGFHPRVISQGNMAVHTQQDSELTPDEQKKALEKLTKEIYNPTPKRIVQRLSMNKRDNKSSKSFNEKAKEIDEDDKRCAICLDDFEPRQLVVLTPCSHMFHEDCIVPWVKSNGKCPVCRSAICERIKESAVETNNGTSNVIVSEPFAGDLISILRAMDDAFEWGNVRMMH
ncbi:hypothetical protein RJ639_009196 [Escallonia herrerae]|uniref:RING-type domain-containing protein n=1 Tax=Escallonia herrerae TaxID=1293975 RepID=A0AA88VNV6_9ASTE|nr:hypothetical protein RJ639_009196 [Escallonia herrerae]